LSTARFYENASATPPVFTGFLDRRELLVKNKRLAAGWDDSYLEQILFGQ
jgi:hypothetical protein